MGPYASACGKRCWSGLKALPFSDGTARGNEAITATASGQIYGGITSALVTGFRR